MVQKNHLARGRPSLKFNSKFRFLEVESETHDVPSFIDVGPAVWELQGFENVDTARTDGQFSSPVLQVISGEVTNYVAAGEFD